jgi:RNA polymerase sigma-70 factor (sigma-E family)
VARQDREAAFADFVAHRWSALYRTAYLLTGDHADAEDILQGTLVRAFTAWARIAKADSAEAYVRRMLINGFISGRRRSSRRGERLQAEPPDLPAPSHDAAVLDRLVLWQQVGRLAPRQRAVVVLRYYEGLSEAQIAEALGCSAGTVKSQASDALRRLRAGLGAEPEAEGTLR